MQIKAEAEVSLFVRDQITGRLVFNSKAIEALGLCPAELAQRGYALDSGATRPINSAIRMTSVCIRKSRVCQHHDKPIERLPLDHARCQFCH